MWEGGSQNDACPAHFKPENKPKNRYNDIFTIEATRVKLTLKTGQVTATREPHASRVVQSTTDYIHANYVRGPPFLNDFICTQVSRDA